MSKVTKLKTKEVRELLSQPTPEKTQEAVAEMVVEKTAEEKARERQHEMLMQFVNAMAIVAGSDAGVIVFREISAICGWDQISTAVGPTGDISPNSTIHNEGMRAVWQKLRQFLPYDKRILIENPPPQQAPVPAVPAPEKPNA